MFVCCNLGDFELTLFAWFAAINFGGFVCLNLVAAIYVEFVPFICWRVCVYLFDLICLLQFVKRLCLFFRLNLFATVCGQLVGSCNNSTVDVTEEDVDR